MVDIFLMGTAGDSVWREPIKAECADIGIDCFDPVVAEWNDEAKRREVEALQSARVVVMAITADTASVASLAESGWAALSAITRRQHFGLYIDPMFEEKETGTTGFGGWLFDTFFGSRERAAAQTLEEASQRARKLVIGHAGRIITQFPELPLYVAKSLQDLQDWAVKKAQQLKMPS